MMQIVPWVETPWELQKFYCHQGWCDFHSKYWRKEFWETVDSTDFICVSTSSQELCCWILDAFIEIILYHQRNGDLAWGWVPKFQGSSQETNFIHGCLAVHAVNHETIQSVRSWIIMDHCIECVPGLIMYTCSDTDRRVVQLRTWAPIWWLSQIFGSWPKWTDTTRRCRAGSKGTVVSALGSFRWSEATWKPFETNDRPPFVSFGDLSHAPTQQKNHGIHRGYWGLPQKYAAIYCNEIYRKSITLLWRLPRQHNGLASKDFQRELFFKY